MLPCMGDVVDIESVRAALRDAMARKGIKPTTLSLKVGNSKTLVKDLMEKSNDVTVGTLQRLASALDVPVQELVAAPPVPIVGYIGAGGTIVFEEFETGETVPRPAGISGTLEALMVRGESMFPKYKDGDIVYIQKQHDGLLDDYLGEDCAVRLKSGETYIKHLIAGSVEGRHTLISLNAGPMENVEVEWATPVVSVLFARSRQRFS